MGKRAKVAVAEKRQKKQKEDEGSFGRPGHEQLVKGLSHPVRTQCLTVLTDRIASPREISEIIDEDLSNVSYHVRVLGELGLIELVSEEPVRGASPTSTKRWNDRCSPTSSGNRCRSRSGKPSPPTTGTS